MRVDDLAVEQGFSQQPPAKVEVPQVLFVAKPAHGVHLHAHLVYGAVGKQRHVRVEELLRHELEPLPGQPPRVDAGLVLELEPKRFSHVFLFHRHDRLHRVDEQVRPPHVDADMPLLPRHLQVGDLPPKPRFLGGKGRRHVARQVLRQRAPVHQRRRRDFLRGRQVDVELPRSRRVGREAAHESDLVDVFCLEAAPPTSLAALRFRFFGQ
mmetsp:Transcript_90825/g.181178  ORF Transcript_90825/g.181178 Transcript_90825/m.181178 type:complete len:210 (-) Transcript_90825:1194-1823(-)